MNPDTDEFDVAVDGYFAIVPEWVIDADISDRAVRLYAVLRRHANSRLMSRPSRAKLAERMRASLSSIDRALRELESVGAVTIRHRWTNAKGDYVFTKDAEHSIPAPSGYLLHNTPAVSENRGGLVTGDDTPLVTGDHTVSSPVTTPLSSPVEGGVSSPVTHELKPIEPKPVKDQRTSSSAKPSTPEVREDVEALCLRLRDRMIENGNRPPNITEKWRTEARLLLDKDGVPLDKALNLIDWCQADAFWHRNILSMPKFREQYDQLRLNALKEYERRVTPPANGSTADQRVAQAQAAKAALAARLQSDPKALMS